MAGWYGEGFGVKGSFLKVNFGDEEKIFMEVSQGFEKHHEQDVVLLLLKTIYGLKQAAAAFWKELLDSFYDMEFKRSKADPCLYYKWKKYWLVLWIS